jgi:hypothetical protein
MADNTVAALHGGFCAGDRPRCTCADAVAGSGLKIAPHHRGSIRIGVVGSAANQYKPAGQAREMSSVKACSRLGECVMRSDNACQCVALTQRVANPVRHIDVGCQRNRKGPGM